MQVNAQSNPLNLGIERFGLSVDEPFHTAWHIYQDSLGRLVSYTDQNKNETLIYDGKKFKKESILPPSESILMRNDNGGYWKQPDAFTATYVKNGKELSLDVRKYLERNICFLYINNGIHYLLANDGIIKFDLVADTIQVIEHYQYPVDRIERAYFIEDTIFIRRNRDVAYILKDSPSEIVYTGRKSYKTNSVMSLTGGRMVVENYNGSQIVHKGSLIYEYLKKHEEYMMSPFIDSKGRLWCNLRTDKAPGLYVYDPKEEIHHEIELGIEKRNLINLFEDNLGDIWVSTSTQGIVHLYDQSVRLIDKSVGAQTDNISAVYQSHKTGNIYTSMNYQGIDIFDNRGENKIGHIQCPGSQKSILVDRQDRMWVISNGVALIQNDKLKKYYTKRDGFHSGTVWSIFEDSSGEIWAGTRQVLHKFVDERWKKYQIPSLDVYDKIVGIAELTNQHLLLAVDNGQYYIFDGRNFEKIDMKKMIPNSLFTDLDGTIWLATENSGLLYWNGHNFTPVMPNDYLTSIPIRNLQDSKEGLLFGLCAENKIFYVNKFALRNTAEPKSIKWLSIDSGIPLMNSKRSRPPSTALLQSGEVVFPNVYGAIVIDPKKIFAKKDSFHLVVMQDGELVNNNTIELNYGENDLSLEIGNIYLNPQASFANQYKIGDGTWKDIKANKNLELRELPRGTNSIRVRGKHVNGEWQKPILFDIVVPAMIYERWWFILGIPTLLGFLFYGFVKYRMRKIRARNQELKIKVDDQTNELKEEKKQLAESLITQTKLTQELNLSQALKNRMYAQISHEFKSPLQAIKSHLSTTDGYLHVEDRVRIKGNINNLLEISSEILELSKAESGNLKIKKNWYNINGIINDQVELMFQLAEQKGITISHPSQNNRQFLNIDISLMQKVISNLLSNAIKFSPEGGVITINSTINGDLHHIEVVDEGLGIPNEEIQNLTLAYYQATNNMASGTGIGLSLVKEILKLHNTELTIKSELGKGSSFGFSLERPPISQAEILRQNINYKSIDEQILEIVIPDKPIILAVDDSQDVLYFLKQSLATTYYIITTTNGQEALSALEKITPVAIISDLNMPIMNGLELVKKVRAIQKYQALPFVFLTGSSSEETELQTLKAGADIILQKPIQESILRSQISQLLNRQKSISASIKTSFAHDLLPTNINNDDIELMQALEVILLENIDNGLLKSEEIAQLMGIGEKTLRNRVKGITGLTIIKYFRNFRLEKAKLLLEEGYGNMGEVAVATGFSSLSYFSKSYKGYFGKK